MNAPLPLEDRRTGLLPAIWLSVLIPGAGHLLVRARGWALFWFLLCQGLLFGGILLAGASQLDHGSWVYLGSFKAVFLIIPEMGNFLGTQMAAMLFHSVEMGGRTPEVLAFRGLGYLMSGASGILAVFSAAHASGMMVARKAPVASGRVQPGTAALATLICPGLGHWITGRRFKAFFFGGCILGLFFLGMFLSDFADFERVLHPYYWSGQMFLGVVGWVVDLVSGPIRFHEVPTYLDAGLLFTTSAGLFTIVAALDAYRRAETDLFADSSEEEERG
ncbi:MAG: DUF6677 family protein [Planctomycetota bacterium]